MDLKKFVEEHRCSPKEQWDECAEILCDTPMMYDKKGENIQLKDLVELCENPDTSCLNLKVISERLAYQARPLEVKAFYAGYRFAFFKLWEAFKGED